MENDKLSDFNMIKGKNKDIYKIFFADNEFVKECLDNNQIYKTWWTGKGGPVYSNSSCSFIDGRNKKEEQLKTETKERLVELFKPKSIERFGRCFDEAVGGSGQEWMEIATLSSSSLIALLCFYNVSPENPLCYKIGDEMCKFTQSYFECQNKIKNASSPSNMDVVLTGTIEGTNDRVILFLESKFSEYLSGGKKDNISNQVYGDIYRSIKRSGISGLEFVECGDTWTIQSKKGESHYCEGIKQMISHYLGITKGIEDEHFGKESSASYIPNRNFKKIYLGEVLYQFPNNIDNGKLKDYADIYNDLASYFNNIAPKDSRFSIISDIIPYQKIFERYKLDNNVKLFYKL